MLNKPYIGPDRQKIIVYVFLTLVTLAVFWQANHYDFVHLDSTYVTDNSHLQKGVTPDGLRWAFSTTYGQYWHPVTWISLMLDYKLFGPNAGGYHATNVILHLMSALLLFALFSRMTGEIWKSAFVAALFALHPLRVESVVWISKRRDLLCVLFTIITLCLYVYYTEKPVIRRYLPALFCFVLALMSKPMAVTLPVIMILLDYWPLKRFGLQKGNPVLGQIKEKTPFFAISAVFSVITIYARDSSILNHFSFSSRLYNALVSFVTYLEKMFWPYDLTVSLLFPDNFPLWQVWGSAILIIAVTAAVIFVMKRFPYLFAGWLWYAITILPTLGFIQYGNFSMSDHHTYLPSIGISIMLAWGIPSLIRNEETGKKILFPAAVIFLAVMSFLGWQQCGYWKNSEKLWTHHLEVTKNNLWAYVLLSSTLSEQGKFEEAVNNYNRMISQQFKYVKYEIVYNNRGNAYSKLGNRERAIEDYSEAIRLQPDYAEAYYNRGTVYIESGQYQKAVRDYTEAIRIKPDYTQAYFNRGMAYSRIGRYQAAIGNYTEAIRLKPDYAEAYNNRSAVYLNLGDTRSGCLDAAKACEMGSCKILKITTGNGVCHNNVE